jgi:hypothetical protein
LEAGADEVAQEAGDLLLAVMVARPAVRALVETQDRVVGEAREQRLDVARVQPLDVTAELEEEEARQERA